MMMCCCVPTFSCSYLVCSCMVCVVTKEPTPIYPDYSYIFSTGDGRGRKRCSAAAAGVSAGRLHLRGGGGGRRQGRQGRGHVAVETGMRGGVGNVEIV